MMLMSLKLRMRKSGGLYLGTFAALLALPACLIQPSTSISGVPEPVQAGRTLIDPSAIDASVNPCDDFYQYACGGWIKNFKLPDDQSSFTRSFDTIYNRNLEINNDILKAYAAQDYGVPSKYAPKLGQFYAACMNTDQIEKETPGFIARAFSRVDELGSKADLPALVAKLQLEGANVLFGFGADSDAKDSNQEIAEFAQGGMGLPNNSYYLDDRNADARVHYLTHVGNMLRLAGLADADAQAGAATVMRLETALARAALRQEDLSDPQRVYNPSDVAGLRAQLPAFDVDAFFSALGLAGIRSLNVTEPKFLKAVNDLIASTSLEDLKLYLKWHVLQATASDLGDAFRRESFAFNGAYLNGAKKMSERWKHCVSATEGAMGEALGEAYVNKTFGADGKKKAQEMIARIRQAFRENLARVDWLDDATRAKAAEKLDKVLPKIGYPDKFRAYDGLSIGDSFVENVVSGAIFESRRQMATIGKPVDKSAWGMYPQTVNAYYNPNWNEIVFPAGILQSPFFSKDATDGANFGGIGMVMGHELTHGFDSSGRQYDGDGNLVDWWTKSATDAFDTKTKCMIDQFNQYEVVPGVFLNGKQTLTENIADLGGIKLAFNAFQSIAKNRPAMPSVGGFTETQQFFLSFAQGWCTVETPEIAKLLAQTDVHSDARFRVNGSLVNTPAFADVFGCSRGTPMAPKDHCSLW